MLDNSIKSLIGGCQLYSLFLFQLLCSSKTVNLWESVSLLNILVLQLFEEDHVVDVADRTSSRRRRSFPFVGDRSAIIGWRVFAMHGRVDMERHRLGTWQSYYLSNYPETPPVTHPDQFLATGKRYVLLFASCRPSRRSHWAIRLREFKNCTGKQALG